MILIACVCEMTSIIYAWATVLKSAPLIYIYIYFLKVCLVLKVFLQTVEPCLRFIDEWVMSGCLCDPHNEFFIQRFAGLLLVLWFLDCFLLKNITAPLLNS